ncbi:gephyrin-like molybdotransferase Glp [Segetibacter koreensis]|uniref:molybdopterin molybdotransferase MoeA n=1 Tax=Segetibacter koreensis TaxID=398037 RepID=UPI00037B0A6E|nr:gephyrin-like molybdotransferase Glp [Segetibacter koreensis]
MISVSEAKNIVRTNTEPLIAVTVPLQQASGLVLAENIYASVDIPAFNQSAMDGYAFAFGDYSAANKLQIAGEVPAGVDVNFENLVGKAVRIFTGAPVPKGADTVVMQEKTAVENNRLLVLDEQLVQGSNVRQKGSEIAAGALGLKKGTFLSPAAIGFLAGIGVAQLNVYPKPAVTLIVTGKELQQPGKPLQAAQVYESNSLTLRAALQQLHIFKIEVIVVDDDIDVLQKTLRKSLQTSDIVLLTGGISVGDYDFVLQAAELCGIEKKFHKIKQRPGKPLYFGKKQATSVFGLPGNPSSVLTCFYEYVIPAIEEMTMRKGIIVTEQLILGKAYSKKTGLTHFLKGKKEGKFVYALDAQESYRLSSFANADCLICLPENKEEFKDNDLVEVHILPV